MKEIWSKNSWRNFHNYQHPSWTDRERIEDVISKLCHLPSLVFSGETRKLKREIAQVSQKKRFILQAGNCAESFSDCNGPLIHNFLRIILQMSMILEFETNRKIIKIGRIAGQYAKPRSSNFETINGKTIPSYRGDNINEFDPNLEARIPKPEKLIEGYFRSTATLNLIRAFIQGGYSDITNLYDWKKHFFSQEISELSYYNELEKKLSSSLNSGKQNFLIDNDQIYISHECLILDYEEAFTRIDTTYGGYYDTSAHFLWIGDRTRQLDSAHVEFVQGIGNPIGIKIGPKYNPVELIDIIKKINPINNIDKIVLIIRMGYQEIKNKFKPIIQIIKDNGLNVTWVSDPMHGNTFFHNNYKVRSFDNIVTEIEHFFRICNEESIIPGGLHLEITEENVTECIGGINGLTLDNIGDNYTTKVDPRLNAAQALEIAFLVNQLLKLNQGDNNDK